LTQAEVVSADDTLTGSPVKSKPVIRYVPSTFDPLTVFPVAQSPKKQNTKEVSKRIPWTYKEDIALVKGTKYYGGEGHWREIYDLYITEFNTKRTNVALKDRYRTLLKHKFVNPLTGEWNKGFPKEDDYLFQP